MTVIYLQLQVDHWQLRTGSRCTLAKHARVNASFVLRCHGHGRRTPIRMAEAAPPGCLRSATTWCSRRLLLVEQEIRLRVEDGGEEGLRVGVTAVAIAIAIVHFRAECSACQCLPGTIRVAAPDQHRGECAVYLRVERIISQEVGEDGDQVEALRRLVMQGA